MSNTTKKLKMTLLRNRASKLIESMPLASKLVAVAKNHRNIRYIKNPSLTVQLEAVKGCPYAIWYIDNPSLEVQLIVAKNLLATQLVGGTENDFAGSFKGITYNVIINDAELLNYYIIDNLLDIEYFTFSEDERVALQVIKEGLRLNE